MQIDNHILTIGNHTEELPRLSRPATVTVWRVPVEYVATGYFVATNRFGEPETIPACAAEDAVLLGRLDLPAHPEAVLTTIATAENRRTAIITAQEELALGTISGMSYAQLDFYIDANVTDLAKARAFLKKLSRVVKALVDNRQE